MRKVGLVTLYKDNFGSILQAYSTYSYVKILGFEPYVVFEDIEDRKESKLVKIKRNLLKIIENPQYLFDKIKSRKAAKKDINLLSKKTKEKMDAFIEREFRIEKIDREKDYSYFIAGSDQVWNGYSPFSYLAFTSKDKRIAFAPSFGAGKIKDYWKKEIRKGLEGFDILSAREETGIKIIKELTNRDALRLADPTLLLSKNEWEEFSKKGMQENNYVLLHFLNMPNELALKKIKEYFSNHNCKVYAICNNYNIEGWNFIDINPYDYVSLINNANMVFTDSFHSTLFSLNLETQFYTFDRQYLHGNSQSSRIVDLLNRVNMKDRFVLNDRILDFDNLESWDSDFLFFSERKTIQDYLKTALKA